ncbi:MAG: hypothetical protein B7Y41_01075 [Hydrogenophilales bacterium 28-61-23]|nr:MAG: hypothetical protein B7Y41_01075 [Hydrogenophilales bacterium 28-61-23]
MRARLFAFVRSVLLKTPAKIAVGLLAAYFLFAWFGFEPLVKWAAPKYIADKSQHKLQIAEARFDPFALSVSIKGLKLAEPDGKPLLAFGELFVDFDASSLFKWAYAFDNIRLSAPDAQLELRADGSLNWAALIEALKSKDEEEDKPLPRLLIRRIALEQGRVAVADRKVGFETTFNPLDLSLADISTLPDDKGAYSLVATTQLGARIRWKGDVTLKPVLATGELAIDQLTLTRFWPYVKGNLAMAPPEGTAALALSYRAAYVNTKANKKFSLLLDKLSFSLDGLALKGLHAKEPAIKLDKLALSGGRFDLEKREFSIGDIALNGGKIALRRDKAGRLDIQDWFPPAAPSAQPVAQTQKSAQAGRDAPWRINLNRFALNGLGIQFSDAGFSSPLQAEVGNVQIGFAAKAEAGGAQTQAVVEGLGIDISGIRLLSGNAAAPLFVLGGVALSEGHIDLAARQAKIGKISLSNGKVDAVRDARGHMALLEAFKPAAGKSAAPAVASATKNTDSEPGWRYNVNRIDLAGFQIGVRDESVQPAAGLTLEKVEASASGVSENLKTPLPVHLGFQVKQGGSFQAEGKVVPAAPSAEVKLKLNKLSLLPAQPYLGQAANLVMASGHISTHGQVKFEGGKNAAPKVGFRGGFEVADLLLNESEGGARFLAWKRLGSNSVRASQSALNIDELRFDRLGAKLVIFKDKTVNLKRIMKSAPEAPASTVPVAPAAEPIPKAKPDADAFQVAIDRIRIENGELDFADYSLSLPFGTRIHALKGAFNGISTKPGTVAELEIDGQVDEFGLARAVGQVDLFNPTDFMDIKTVFRNVEMTNLTPYSATFAGRKIASGKLSLDLEYKIKQRQLLGENQIVMDKLTLGERVESPGAKDLPLDLAIAILQDSDGKIDLGLPVSGSLDDPQFSYGRIIWKAIGNILTKIVTAPFRALGALFGGGGEKLEKVAFEAGEDALTPPEKEKFKQISQILNKRPGLALGVHGVWAAAVDRPVMKETQLRRAVAETMGVKLAPTEDPGPVSTGNPKSQAALEALYAQRFGKEEWAALSAKWRQANPDKKLDSGAGKMLSRLKGLLKTEQPLSADETAQLKDADLHALLYQRLLDKETVSDDELKNLAARRGEALAKGLAAAGAPSQRIKLGEVAAVEADGHVVQVKLELGVAK